MLLLLLAVLSEVRRGLADEVVPLLEGVHVDIISSCADVEGDDAAATEQLNVTRRTMIDCNCVWFACVILLKGSRGEERWLTLRYY